MTIASLSVAVSCSAGQLELSKFERAGRKNTPTCKKSTEAQQKRTKDCSIIRSSFAGKERKKHHHEPVEKVALRLLVRYLAPR